MSYTQQRTAALVAALVAVLTLSLAAPPTTHASTPDGSTGGPVTGRVIAAQVYSNLLGLCATACRAAGDGPISDLPAPDHTLEVDKAGRFTSGDAVEAGTYRVRFDGESYDDLGAFGYLRQTTTGRYRVVKAFDQGTPFTVEEAQGLDAGTLDLRSGLVSSAGPMTAYGSSFGGPIEMTGLRAKFRARDIPADAVVVFRTTGCGKTYVRKFRKVGSYTFTWQDARASKRYGKKMAMRIAIERTGDLPVRFNYGTFDLSNYKWRCP